MTIVAFLLWIPGSVFLFEIISGMKFTDPVPPLVGVIEKKIDLDTSYRSLVEGKFQRNLSVGFPQHLPFYATITRCFNQIQYSLLGLSSNREVLVGREGILHGTTYAKNSCQQSLTTSKEKINEWAENIANIQNIIRQRGQNFLYVLTPSKADFMPETLPFGYPCPATAEDRISFVTSALAALDKRDVHYFDATDGLNRTKELYGFDPFPKGGIHWTDLAAHLATQGLVDKLNFDLDRENVSYPYKLVVTTKQIPTMEEQDFAQLMNVAFTPSNYLTAEITVSGQLKSLCDEPVNIVVVGGSFFTSIGRALSRSPCNPSIRQLSYLTISQVDYGISPGKLVVTAPDLGILKQADIIIVEENMGILMNSRHIPAFLQLLEKESLQGQ